VTGEQRRAVREEVDRRRRSTLGLRPPPPPAADLTARRAGRANVAALLAAFERAGAPLTMHEAGLAAGVGTGTLTWAVRALVATGRLRATGERRGRSAEYELTA
jgi:hypothetical protein